MVILIRPLDLLVQALIQFFLQSLQREVVWEEQVQEIVNNQDLLEALVVVAVDDPP
tara:strand:+ start:188 stop:355 length:168 start_codon:yes stop_codon:yes gene_type:complete